MAQQEKDICKFCRGEETNEQTGPLVSPCSCKGTMKYVHLACLMDYITKTDNIATKTHCPACRSAYPIKRKAIVTFLERKWCKGLVAILLMSLIHVFLLFFSVAVYMRIMELLGFIETTPSSKERDFRIMNTICLGMEFLIANLTMMINIIHIVSIKPFQRYLDRITLVMSLGCVYPPLTDALFHGHFFTLIVTPISLINFFLCCYAATEDICVKKELDLSKNL